MKPAPRSFAVAIAAAAVLLGAPAACATEPVTPARALAARGPLALTFAADPATTHWSLETGWPLFAGRERGSAAQQVFAGPRLALNALVIASRDWARAPRATNAFVSTLLLDRQAGPSASWLGVSFGGAESDPRPDTRLRLAVGFAHAFPGVRAEGTLISSSVVYRNDPRWTRTHHYQYLAGPDTIQNWRDTSVTVPAEHATTWTTAQGALRWQRGRWAVETVGGVAIGERVGPRRWAQGVMRVQLSRRVLALASFGERPASSLAFNGSAQPRSMIGVQLAPWSTPEWEMTRALHPVMTRWKTESAGPGRIVIRVHCRDTRRVEIAGDFTDWQPVSLLRLNGGWWGVMVPAESGPHRVQIRLDGGTWLAPRGLLRAEDGPAGEAATLIVP